MDRRLNSSHATAFLGLVLFPGACAESVPEPPRQTVRDSATGLFACSKDSSAPVAAVEVWDSSGVTIVASSVEATVETPPFSFSEEPLFGLEGPFHRITREVFPRGVAVADEFANEIRSFDRRGVLLSKVGGRGEGPDEFPRAPHIVRDQADPTRVFAYDGRVKKVLLYDPTSGTLVPHARLKEVHGEVGARGPVAATNGTLIFVGLDVNERALMAGEEGPIAMPEYVRNDLAAGIVTSELGRETVLVFGIGGGL